MTSITRRTKRYPSDLTDEEWERIAPLILPAHHRGGKRTTDLREIINALRYPVRSGYG
ncbi:transposase [Komagataeibacter diospyri]|nr:transposase [Komagataeibacter diospyri]